MKTSPIIALASLSVLLLTSCSGAANDEEALVETAEITSVEPEVGPEETDSPEPSAEDQSLDIATEAEAPVAQEPAPTEEQPAREEESPEEEPEQEDPREDDEEEAVVDEDQAEPEQEQAAPVLPEVYEISFSCRSSRLTAEVHAKIPGTTGSEGRYYFGISNITAFRKNEYNAELDHDMKWDGSYDPERDKWVSAEPHISGERYDDKGDPVRFLIEGRDAAGNDVELEVIRNHGTNC